MRPRMPSVHFTFLMTSRVFSVFRDSPHVLIQRSITATGFAAQSSLLSEYLCGVITGRCNNQLDVGALTANIASWEKRDVELLSEMSMDSMQELYSKFQTYDDRWNEVLMRPPTPELRTWKVSV